MFTPELLVQEPSSEQVGVLHDPSITYEPYGDLLVISPPDSNRIFYDSPIEADNTNAFDAQEWLDAFHLPEDVEAFFRFTDGTEYSVHGPSDVRKHLQRCIDHLAAVSRNIVMEKVPPVLVVRHSQREDGCYVCFMVRDATHETLAGLVYEVTFSSSTENTYPVPPHEVPPPEEFVLKEEDIEEQPQELVQQYEELEEYVPISDGREVLEQLFNESIWQTVAHVEMEGEQWSIEMAKQRLEEMFENSIGVRYIFDGSRLWVSDGQNLHAIAMLITASEVEHQKQHEKKQAVIDNPTEIAIETLFAHLLDSAKELNAIKLSEKKAEVAATIPYLHEAKLLSSSIQSGLYSGITLTKEHIQALEREQQIHVELSWKDELDSINTSYKKQLQVIEVLLGSDQMFALADAIIQSFGFAFIFEKATQEEKDALCASLLERSQEIKTLLSKKVVSIYQERFIAEAANILHRTPTPDELDHLASCFVLKDAPVEQLGFIERTVKNENGWTIFGLGKEKKVKEAVGPNGVCTAICRVADRAFLEEIQFTVTMDDQEIVRTVSHPPVPSPTDVAIRVEAVQKLPLSIDRRKKLKDFLKAYEQVRQRIEQSVIGKTSGVSELLSKMNKSPFEILSNPSSELYKKFVELCKKFEKSSNGLPPREANVIREYLILLTSEESDTIPARAASIDRIDDYVSLQTLGIRLLPDDIQTLAKTIAAGIQNGALTEELMAAIPVIERQKKQFSRAFSTQVQDTVLQLVLEALTAELVRVQTEEKLKKKILDSDIPQTLALRIGEMIYGRLAAEANSVRELYTDMHHLFAQSGIISILDLGWKPDAV